MYVHTLDALPGYFFKEMEKHLYAFNNLYSREGIMVDLKTSLIWYSVHTQNYCCLHWKSSVSEDCKSKLCSVNNTFRAFLKRCLSHKVAPAFEMDFPHHPSVNQCVRNYPQMQHWSNGVNVLKSVRVVMKNNLLAGVCCICFKVPHCTCLHNLVYFPLKSTHYGILGHLLI